MSEGTVLRPGESEVAAAVFADRGFPGDELFAGRAASKTPGNLPYGFFVPDDQEADRKDGAEERPENDVLAAVTRQNAAGGPESGGNRKKDND